MKRIYLLLFLLLVACSPVGTQEAEEETAALAEAISPATSVTEASDIRDRDWVLGAQEPSVTIIEYGDFQ